MTDAPMPISGTHFGAIIDYKIKCEGVWHDRTVFLVNKQHAINWLTEDWVDLSTAYLTVLVDVQFDQPVCFSDIDPIDVMGYEDPTDADMIFSMDVKQNLVKS
jgi:hypothetical protein